jgi:hypothetical protein
MISPDEIKILAKMPDSEDAFITAMIPVGIEIINTYCNTEYTDDNLPASLRLALANIIKFEAEPANKKGVASESLGNYSVSYTAKANYGYPKNITDVLDLFTIKPVITAI